MQRSRHVLEEEEEAADIAPDELRAQGAHGVRQARGQVRGAAAAVGLDRGQQPDPQVHEQAAAAGGPLGDHAHGDPRPEDHRAGRPPGREPAERAPAEDAHGQWDHAAEGVQCGQVQFVEVVQSAQAAQGSQVFAGSESRASKI